MVDCLVTGMPNVGKTCFVINFAEYMGLKKLKFYLRQQAGYTAVKSYTPGEARSELVSVESNFTREIQSVKMEIPKGKGFKELEIIDTCGLSSGIHPEENVRLAMARTIRLIRESNLVLHIIDLTNIKSDKKDILLPVDRMILDYARLEKNYAILVNKIDLKTYLNNLNIIQEFLSSINIIPISALYQQGFKKVKAFIMENV